LVTHKQSSTPYNWLTPGYYKDKVKTSAVYLPFTFDRHLCDLPQHPLKLISAPLAPQVKKPCSRGFSKQHTEKSLEMIVNPDVDVYTKTKSLENTPKIFEKRKKQQTTENQENTKYRNIS